MFSMFPICGSTRSNLALSCDPQCHYQYAAFEPEHWQITVVISPYALTPYRIWTGTRRAYSSQECVYALVHRQHIYWYWESQAKASFERAEKHIGKNPEHGHIPVMTGAVTPSEFEEERRGLWNDLAMYASWRQKDYYFNETHYNLRDFRNMQLLHLAKNNVRSVSLWCSFIEGKQSLTCYTYPERSP